MTQRNNVDVLRRKLIAVDFLEKAAADLAQAKLTRARYVRAAREHGLSNQTIGDALGVSEARVRQMLKEACWNCGDAVVSGGLCADCSREDGGDE